MAIRTFIGQVASWGGALLLTGEPGIGKSALLDIATKAAVTAGMQVVHANGTESAAGVSFAALDQVLASRRLDFGQLPLTYREALTVALGLGEGPAPLPLVLSNAILELFTSADAASGTLIVVDDLHWVDRDSVEVLALAARRLAGTNVGFLAASRPTLPEPFATAGLIEHPVRPLPDGSAAKLLRTRFPTLGAHTLERVLIEAQGNPLALVELPSSLTSAQRAEIDPLPTVLPVSERLVEVFAPRLGDLPSDTRDLLLLVALEGSGELRTLSAAASRLSGLDQLTQAERESLVFVDASTRTVVFSHPVVRACVVDGSTEIQRRRLHRVLAETLVDEPERRAWHLAHACAQPDAQVASLLEKAGHVSLRRGDGLSARAALIRAAELSVTQSDIARCLADAAYVSAAVTGQLVSAVKLLGAVRTVQPEAAESLRAKTVIANVLFNSGCDLQSVHQLLMDAVVRYRDECPADDETLEDALYSLFMFCWYAGRATQWEPIEQAVAVLTPQAPALLSLSAKAFGNPIGQASSWVAELDATSIELNTEFDPVTITRTAAASIYTDRLGNFREALWRVIRNGREGGAVALSISAFVSSCIDDWLTGQWDEALSLAQEGAQLSAQHGYPRSVDILGGYIRPLILVVRGVANGLAGVEELAVWASRQGVGMATTLADHVRTLSAIGSGDFEGAYRHASAISPPGVFARHTPHALWVLLDLVESAVRTGRNVEASSHVDAMRIAHVSSISTRLALVVAGATAIAEDGEEATKLYDRALAIAGAYRWPFDLARIELCYGEHLCRQGAGLEARVHLRAAMEIFDRLGARPWIARTGESLRAAGSPRSPSTKATGATLTPQELEIATLAATGLRNKQIAAKLYLSHRTVGAQLCRVFPKLGVTSRASLGDALDALSLPPGT